MRALIRVMASAAALAACSAALAASSASVSYAMPARTINSGISDVASASVRLSSSLGSGFRMHASGGAQAELNPGLRGAIAGLGTGCLLDVDGNGVIDPLTDGLLILRAMSGLSGPAAANAAIGHGATRTAWPGIAMLIRLPALDVDGNGTVDAATDGLLLIRAMFGMTGTAVTDSAVAIDATRKNWADIRGYLSTRCAMRLSP